MNGYALELAKCVAAAFSHGSSGPADVRRQESHNLQINQKSVAISESRTQVVIPESAPGYRNDSSTTKKDVRNSLLTGTLSRSASAFCRRTLEGSADAAGQASEAGPLALAPG